MPDRVAPTLADGQPYLGELVAVVDESAQDAGGGVYYVVAAAVLLDADRVATGLVDVLAGRRNPFHWAREGPEIRDRMLTLMVGSIVGATVQWSSSGRRGQMNARGEMLSAIATWAHAEGVDHLVIEASDEAINLRDRQVLARHPLQQRGGLRFHYDHRSKSEPLLWIADALAGAVGEHLIGKNSAAYDRLVTAGVVAEV